MVRGVSSAMQLARLVTCSSDNGGHGEADRRSSHPPGNSGDRELGLQWAAGPCSALAALHGPRKKPHSRFRGLPLR